MVPSHWKTIPILGFPVFVSLFLFCRYNNDHQGNTIRSDASKVLYTIQDDMSWALVHRDQLSIPDQQELYDNFMDRCNDITDGDCELDEEGRLYRIKFQPGSVYNYTQRGFQKAKAPAHIMSVMEEFWVANKDKGVMEWDDVNPYHNMWEAPPYLLNLQDESYEGGGTHFRKMLWEATRPIMEAWTGQRLVPSSMFGIREYRNGSILAPVSTYMMVVIGHPNDMTMRCMFL